MVMTAEVMGIKGVVSAYEVVEMELLGIRGAGVLNFIDLATGAKVDVPHPMGAQGGRGEKERLLEEVERGQKVVMEINISMPQKIVCLSKSAIPEILTGRQIRDTYPVEDVLSKSWTLVD
jgi:hypothetical protein